jgi:hypothetical protein
MKALLLLGLVIIGCGPAVKIVTFDTYPDDVYRGDSAWLYWKIEHADEATLDGKTVNKDSGAVRVLLDSTVTYELRAVGCRSEAVKRLKIVSESPR